MPNGSSEEGTRLVGRLPSELQGGALRVQALAEQGTLEEAAKRMIVHRRPGYLAIDAIIFLIYYFSAPHVLGGLRGFWEMHRSWSPALGALGGRARLMSSTALSRLLKVADPGSLAEPGRWWLLHASGALELLRNPSVLSRDAQGNAWHIFDFDPSRQAYRQRALPTGPDLPPGKRRLSQAAGAGYGGRKRGDVVSSEGLLQHHGSGIWLDATVQSGNGNPRVQLDSALTAVMETCRALDFPTARAMVRTDGQFGNVPSFAAAADAKVAYLSRVSRPELLASPTVRARLDAARWTRVPDSHTGPTRYAADLGELELPPGDSTLRADGTTYGPVTIRVVVSRYRSTGAKKPVGTIIGEEVFECFGAIGLSRDEWPAPTLVAAYYGRCAQENRFSQLDREFDAECTWGETCGGQLLALIVLLFVWNARVVSGVQAHPLPPVAAPTPWIEEVALDLPRLFDDAPVSPPIPPVEARAPDREAAVDPVVAALRAVNFGRIVEGRKGWQWDGTTRAVLSPEGRPHVLIGTEQTPSFLDLRFRARLESGRNTVKSFRLQRPEAEGFLTAWNNRTRERRSPLDTRAPRATSIEAGKWLSAIEAPPGHPQFAPAWPGFQPASARRIAVAAERRRVIDVDMFFPLQPGTPDHPLVQPSPARRRRERLSLAERNARNAVLPGTDIRVRHHDVALGPKVFASRREDTAHAT